MARFIETYLYNPQTESVTDICLNIDQVMYARRDEDNEDITRVRLTGEEAFISIRERYENFVATLSPMAIASSGHPCVTQFFLGAGGRGLTVLTGNHRNHDAQVSLRAP